PALLTRMSILPNSSSAFATVWRAVSSSRTSPVITTQRRPACRASAARASSRSPRRATTTRSAPSSRNRRATAWPMPALAPVTTATLPSSLPTFRNLQCIDRSRRHFEIPEDLNLPTPEALDLDARIGTAQRASIAAHGGQHLVLGAEEPRH